MRRDNTISGIEAAQIYSETLAVRTGEYEKLKNSRPEIDEALREGETSIARLTELSTGLPEEFAERVHKAKIALWAVKNYTERYTH